MSEPERRDPYLIPPPGTHVVTLVQIHGQDGAVVHPPGAVGVVVKSPGDSTHTYLVRFPDALEAHLKRSQFEVRRVHQRQGLVRAGGALAEYDLDAYVIYRCIIGSQAYGLARDTSDVDRRGIYLPPAEAHWSLYGVPEQLERPATDECYWELQKVLVLALKANPNVLECLYTPLVEFATPLAEELLAMREAFLSRLVYQTYNGYVISQFKKLEQDLRNHGQIRWKHAMHLIRLLLSGITALREGRVPVRVEEHRDRLLAIRDEAMPWGDINAWRLALHKEFDAAFAATRLPEQPDYDRANAFLIKARRGMVNVAQ